MMMSVRNQNIRAVLALTNAHKFMVSRTIVGGPRDELEFTLYDGSTSVTIAGGTTNLLTYQEL